MHIIKRELRANLKSLIIWCIIVILLIIMMVSEFSAYYNNPEMEKILSSMPKVLLEAFSITGANLTTTTGFISIASIYFYIMLGFFSVMLGSNIISKEERDKTGEYLLTLPISRTDILKSKLIASIINSIVLNIITGVAIILSMYKYNLDSKFYKFILLMQISIFILQMIYLSLGMLLASKLKRYKSSGKISATILLCTYFLSILIGMSSKIDFLKYLTPFKYFEASYLLKNEKLELVYIIISITIICTCLAFTFINYSKRDLRI